MSAAPALRLVADATASPAAQPQSSDDLGALLVARGVLTAADLLRARAMLAGRDLRLEDALLAHRMVREEALAEIQALHWQAERVDPDAAAVDVRLVDAVGAAACLRRSLLPLRRAGAETVVATARPDRFERDRTDLQAALGPVRMAVAAPSAIERTLLRLRQRSLARAAETRVAEDESCRGTLSRRVAAALLGFGVGALALACFAPGVAAVLFTGWAALTLIACTALKAAALISTLGAPSRPSGERVATLSRSPVVSLLVPLFREREIASRLVTRLSRLDYPAELLDICLVVEESDTITQATIAATRLPPFMRMVVVPRGGVQTKPRALNYALDFCRGSIVGVYDAEDRPDPAQIRAVVEGFATRGPEIACLQGILDYYNASENWLSRCFTIEYAAWFRVVLPGLARLGLVVPLGGTTLFFRREALERLGGWDAHNVTEDADLGLRLSRHGYRTELLDTVTQEEANCRPLPWVRQRSRWLKGYAMTYAAHMRNPLRLWRELGAWRFLGVQVTFLGTLSQFALAPVLWSFWLLLLGLPHPLSGIADTWLWGLTGAFLISEAVNLAAGLAGVGRRSHRWLVPWVPTLHFYYPLGALAAWKGVAEIVIRPYFWDKTAHGGALSRDDSARTFSHTPAPPRVVAVVPQPHRALAAR